MAPAPLRWLAALCAAAAMGSAAAQALQAPESAAVACMTPPPELRPKIVYPAELLERREGGTVTVEMDFVAPDRPRFLACGVLALLSSGCACGS